MNTRDQLMKSPLLPKNSKIQLRNSPKNGADGNNVKLAITKKQDFRQSPSQKLLQSKNQRAGNRYLRANAFCSPIKVNINMYSPPMKKTSKGANLVLPPLNQTPTTQIDYKKSTQFSPLGSTYTKKFINSNYWN